VFRFVKGPLFANIILADEINRTPPKTQSALLEAMQERQLTVGGETYPLPEPFFVLATQNPIEQEGTYPLPEAQLDRFMFKISSATPRGARDRDRQAGTTEYSFETREVLSREENRPVVSDHTARCRWPTTFTRRRFGWFARRGPTRTNPPEFINEMVKLGRRPAGVHLPAAGGQGPGGAAQPLPRHHRGLLRWPRRSCAIA